MPLKKSSNCYRKMASENIREMRHAGHPMNVSIAAGLRSAGCSRKKGGSSLGAGFVAETVLTFMFLMVILGSTDKRAPQGFAPLATGLCLTLIHLIGIPVTNLSVNPARSTAPAVIVGGWALAQLWVSWVAPIVGAVIGGAVYPWVAGVKRADPAR